jgi:ADP-ribose pyrophosphatase YjhB (NUDIX family)
MNFEPQKLFIGLMDFFSILLPGALLIFLFQADVGPIVLGNSRYNELTGSIGWAVFLVASYLFGHVVFLLGSWLDEFYDWVRGYTLNRQISLLAHKGTLLPWPARALIWLVFKSESNDAVECARKLKEQALEPLQAKDAINTFQWCKALLTIESPASLTLVQRLEADSKFFRSLVVVLVVFAASWPFLQKLPLTGFGVAMLLLVWLVLLLLSLWRYFEQRLKATNEAYWSVITLMALKGKAAFEKPAAVTGGPTHAGGIVFRKRGSQIEYLLLESSRDPRKWVLPKGHIEQGEDPGETAVREVHEETGVWGRIIAPVPNCSSYWADGREVKVQFFLMKYAGCGLQRDAKRRHGWWKHADAIANASHDETQNQLRSAEQSRIALKQ